MSGFPGTNMPWCLLLFQVAHKVSADLPVRTIYVILTHVDEEVHVHLLTVAASTSAPVTQGGEELPVKQTSVQVSYQFREGITANKYNSAYHG